jgi:hypothetical protein
MTVKFLDTLDGELADSAWKLYVDAFEELNHLAVQRHLMYRNEFDEVMADTRVDKVLTLDDAGALAGVATFTNELDAVPLIAPQYFEHHWPEHYASKRIWYIGFVAVAPAAQGSGAFTEVFEEFYRIAEPHDGLVGLDICNYNKETHHLPRAIEVWLKRLSRGASRAVRIDDQAFYLYDMTGATLMAGVPR